MRNGARNAFSHPQSHTAHASGDEIHALLLQRHVWMRDVFPRQRRWLKRLLPTAVPAERDDRVCRSGGQLFYQQAQRGLVLSYRFLQHDVDASYTDGDKLLGNDQAVARDERLFWAHDLTARDVLEIVGDDADIAGIHTKRAERLHQIEQAIEATL